MSTPCWYSLTATVISGSRTNADLLTFWSYFIQLVNQDGDLQHVPHPVFEKNHHLYALVGWHKPRSVLQATGTLSLREKHDVSRSPALQAKDDKLIS